MGKLTRINWGNDSTVYLSEDKTHVIKMYDMAIGFMDMETRLLYLNKYVSDTLKASEILSRFNSSRSFSLGSESYPVQILVLPQGEIKEVFPENVDFEPRLGHKSYTAVVGQRFVEGEHYGQIVSNYNHCKYNSIFHDSINTFESAVKGSLEDAKKVLHKNLGIEFILDYANVKPTLDKENKLLKLEITDLADHILVVYNEHVTSSTQRNPKTL
jgi:hypothetical protein